MGSAERHSPQHSLSRTIIERWTEQRASHTLSVLSRAMLEWAMLDGDRTSALVFFKFHKYLEKKRGNILQLFVNMVTQAIDGMDPSIAAIPQQRPFSTELSLLHSVITDSDCPELLGAIHAEVFTTLFQRALSLLDPPENVRELAEAVFEIEFNQLLVGLYSSLLQEWQDNKSANEPSTVASQWDEAEVEQTSTAVEQALNALPESVSDFHNRRHFQQRQNFPSQSTREEALADTNKIMNLLTSKEGAPDSLNALTTKLHPIVEIIALNELGAFLHTLHPAKQLIYEAIYILNGWKSKSRADQLLELTRFKQSIINSSRDITSAQTALAELHAVFLDFVNQEKRAAEVSPPVGDARIPVQVIEEVGVLLDEKLETYDNVPAIIYQFLFGTWNRVIAHYRIENGQNSITAQQALALVDDIMWYLLNDDQAFLYTSATALSDHIEREIKEGLAHIGYGSEHCAPLISGIRMLRQTGLEQPQTSINLAG